MNKNLNTIKISKERKKRIEETLTLSFLVIVYIGFLICEFVTKVWKISCEKIRRFRKEWRKR